MKTNSNTITQPVLFINSAHGQYIPQIFSEMIADELRKQIDTETLQDLSSPENEYYYEAWDNILSKIFRTKTGQKVHFEQIDGDVWCIPACFARTKEYKENWIEY